MWQHIVCCHKVPPSVKFKWIRPEYIYMEHIVTQIRGLNGWKRGGVQCCVFSSRWHLVSQFLWRVGGKHCSKAGKSDYSTSVWGGGDKKSPLNLNPQRSRTTGVVKIKRLVQGRLLNQTDWVQMKTTSTCEIQMERARGRDREIFWASEKVKDKGSDLDRQTCSPKGKRLTCQMHS